MKLLKKDIKNIQFGFVCAGYSPTAGRTIYSKYAKIHLHIIFLKTENIYLCNGMTANNKNKIPFPFNQSEFINFYKEDHPRILNNKEKAVNELIKSVIIN